jgi:hypothetical protein
MKTIRLQQVKSCMGGWCKRRDNCPNYHASDRSNPMERLCGPIEGIPRRPVRKVATEAV